MNTRLTSLLFTTAALAAPIFAQQVEVQCQLADGRQTGCYYCPGYQFVIKFVGTQLQSTAVNLNLYQNSSCFLQGTWNGTVLTVTSAVAAPDTFSIGGNGHIGNRFHFTTSAATGDIALNLVALGTAQNLLFGNQFFMLNPLTTQPLDAGIVGGGGQFTTDLDVPNNPALIGLRVFGQGLVLQQGGSIKLTTIDAKEVN